MFKSIALFLTILQISKQEELCAEENGQQLCKELTKEELEWLRAPTYTDYYGTVMDWQNWTEYRKLQHILVRRKYLVNKEIVPKIWGNGYFKTEMPNQMVTALWDQKVINDMTLEKTCQDFTNCKESYKIPFLHEFIVRDAIAAYVRYPLERWVGSPISESFQFDNIKRFTEGTRLWEHVSDVTNHQFTTLMNVS